MQTQGKTAPRKTGTEIYLTAVMSFMLLLSALSTDSSGCARQPIWMEKGSGAMWANTAELSPAGVQGGTVYIPTTHTGGQQLSVLPHWIIDDSKLGAFSPFAFQHLFANGGAEPTWEMEPEPSFFTRSWFVHWRLHCRAEQYRQTPM